MDKIAEIKKCPQCEEALSAPLASGRIVCRSCGWSDQTKKNTITENGNSIVENLTPVIQDEFQKLRDELPKIRKKLPKYESLGLQNEQKTEFQGETTELQDEPPRLYTSLIKHIRSSQILGYVFTGFAFLACLGLSTYFFEGLIFGLIVSICLVINIRLGTAIVIALIDLLSRIEFNIRVANREIMKNTHNT